FTMPFFIALFMYYSGDSADRYMVFLDEIRATARNRLKEIKTTTDRCPNSGCFGDVKEWAPKLVDHARLAEVSAMNLAAYGIAQDVADGIKSSQAHLPTAEANAEELVKRAAQLEDQEYADSILDTAAFVSLVAEAQKNTRGYEKIR